MELTQEEVGLQVDRAVEALLEAAGCVRPPVDALQLARRHLGLAVCLDRRQPQRGRAQRSNGRGHIFLRPEPRLERRQWAVAHEIGEHLKLHLFLRLGLTADNLGDLGGLDRMTGESLADLFAQRLLVPQRWLAADARALDYELPQLKQVYSTASHEVIAWRLLDLPLPCLITIVDQGRVARRRGNAGPITPALAQLAPAERLCQQQVHEQGRPASVKQPGCTVRGWPIHQPDWKREILRTVLADEWA